jgi:hypothetical protein
LSRDVLDDPKVRKIILHVYEISQYMMTIDRKLAFFSIAMLEQCVFRMAYKQQPTGSASL